jgi:glycerol kinase
MKETADYRVVIDQSTSGTKLLLVEINDQKPSIVKRVDKKHEQFYPQSGWVEHDPVEIVENAKTLFDQLMEETKIKKEQIISISITNQRETIVVWDKSTGKPITNALVWQCNRSLDICNQLIAEKKEELIQEKTGLKVDTYFSAPKLKWLFRERPELQESAKNDELAIGTIDTWLIWNLTQTKVFATEPSNASRTLLYNIHMNEWDKELCELFDTPINSLPEVRSSDSQFGEYKGIPIVGVMADSQAALFGQGSTEVGDVKATLGTGCSVMMQIQDNAKWRHEKILQTIGWKKAGEISYALEGIIRSCTDTLNWLSKDLALFDTVEEGSQIAFSVPDSAGVHLIPGQLGLGAPFWEPNAQASFVGLNRSSTKAHMIRAGFDTIVYQIKAVIDVMEEASDTTIEELRVDGGASKNEQLLQLLADVLQKNILINGIEEMSALGALRMAVEIDTIYKLPKKVYPQKRRKHEYESWLKEVYKVVD